MSRREAPECTAWWRRRYIQWMVPAISAAIVFVSIFTRMIDLPDQLPVAQISTEVLQAIEPIGKLDSPPTLFLWHSSSDADFYKFELFDATSVSVFQHVTADTILTVDPSSSSAPANGYWTVTPLNNLRSAVGGPISARYYPSAGVDTLWNRP